MYTVPEMLQMSQSSTKSDWVYAADTGDVKPQDMPAFQVLERLNWCYSICLFLKADEMILI